MNLLDINFNELNEIEQINIDDVLHLDQKTPIIVYLKKGDDLNYLNSILEYRKNLTNIVNRENRDLTAKNNVLNNLKKTKTKKDLITKIKRSVVKYSTDYDFNYREVCDIIKSKEFYNEIKDIDLNIDVYLENLDDDLLMDIILNQVIYSLEHYTIVHPKINLLINELGKEEDENFNLEFNVATQ